MTTMTDIEEFNLKTIPKHVSSVALGYIPPTYAFGEINSNEEGCQKFVKVNAGTDVKELIEVLKQKWGLSHPNLLISVVGGAWNFPVNNSVREVFRLGIIKATIGTKAIILTSGTNVGAARYVAEAMHQSKIATRESLKQCADVVTVGITSWNTLQGEQRSVLEKALGEKPSETAFSDSYYNSDVKLDPYHTHFIFVHDKEVGSSTASFAEQVKATNDLRLLFEKEMAVYKIETSESDITDVIEQIDPTDQPKLFTYLHCLYEENEAFDKPGGLEVLRRWRAEQGKAATRNTLIRALKKTNAKVGKDVAEQWRDGQVPVVCMYIEGGSASITHACISVENDLPIVAVNHSGRAANVLSMAFKSDGLKRENALLESKLQNILKDDPDNIKERLTTGLKDKHHLWNVYEEQAGLEIDQVILKALMKAYRDDCRRQLALAQTWNRYDLVKSELFFSLIESMEWDDYNAEAEYFEGILHAALVNDQPGFVRLFLDNGVISLTKYLTRKELQNLYNEVEDSPCHELVRGVLMIKHRKADDQTELTDICRVIRKLTVSELNVYNSEDNLNNENPADSNEHLQTPYRHLFLYAVLNQFHEMAHYFWEEGEEHLAAALTAVNIYQNMASRLGDEKGCLAEQARKYEDLACQILSDCDESDRTTVEDVRSILLRILPNWGNLTCLDLADTALCQNFLSHHVVQSLMRHIWKHGLSERKVFAYTPPVKPSSLKGFRASPVAPLGQRDEKEKKPPTTQYRQLDEKQNKEHISKFEVILNWFFSPRLKFFQNTISYILFLALYSYVILLDLSVSVRTWYEWLLIVWGWTLATEEFRQLGQAAISIKLTHYFSDYWNQIDMIMYPLFVVATILLFPSDTRETAKILLAVALFLFYFRLLNAFTISRTIGPKVLMIFKMLVDLGVFLGILFVILIGYGIAMQAILFPHITDANLIYEGIWYRPYFQIYGELFLDDINPPEGTCSSNQSEIIAGASPCPENSSLGVAFLALYMMLSNVLLLNLLIATFGDTFARVQEETDSVWKVSFFFKVQEYLERPLLIPPFIFLEHVYRLCCLIGRKMCSLQLERYGMQRKFSAAETSRLVQLEETVAFDYVTRLKRSQHKSACSCFHQTETSKRSILDRLNEFDEMQTYGGND